jgi:DNA polymerase-3 subunit gamma/tau
MDNFIVSARKYRPSTFDTVVGQDHITNTLKNAIRNNHLAQAFLFCGPRGVGKTTCARILAKTINCHNLTPETEPCNVCESCVSFNNSGSFNIYELDAASNNSVDDIRSLVEQVRYAPQGAKYKIYIIDEVHMLSANAFNAFLKTLEEPPAYAIFILATTEKHKIIPTILSRCQIFDFNRITLKDTISHLKKISRLEHISAEDEALHVIAQKSDGALRDALSIFDQLVSFSGNSISYQDVLNNLNILDYDYYFRIQDALLSGDLPLCLNLFDEILRKGFDGHHFIVGLSEHFRNLMVCKHPSTLRLLEVTENVAQKYGRQAQESSTSFLLNALNIANQCDVQYKASKNQRLHVELALMKICHINSMISLHVPTMNGESADKKKTERTAVVNPVKTSPPAIENAETEMTNTPETAAGTLISKTISSNPAPSGGGGLGLKNLRSKVLYETPKEAASEVEEVQDLPEETGPQPEAAAVNAAWEKYAALMEEKGKPSLQALFKMIKPQLEGSVIRLKVSSDMQFQQVEGEKVSMLAFIREELKNRGITIETIKEKQEEETKKPYTLEDKYKSMAESNPHLNELRNTLGLELDY